mgnify:CR=1 FL=1
MASLEKYFDRYRHNIIGLEQDFVTPYGKKRILYADWVASGRLYKPIEDILSRDIAPYVGNTHTETNVTGTTMTMAYHYALSIIKKHVRAGQSDVIISSNSGMTGVVNKFQRILGLKLHEKFEPYVKLPETERPVVFVTHMEHHSNQTTWLETIADLELIGATPEGLVDLQHLQYLLDKYSARATKIAAVTSCSNVTGVFTPYHEIAGIMHRNGGLCFVDFAASAPYIDINMHPDDEYQYLDAIYFSPHKFLGGPGSSGILVFNANLYKNRVPDHPGGGTVLWTNPWGEHKYIDNIEIREDGGTPAFLQTMKAALAVRLKESMGTGFITKREEEILGIIWQDLFSIPGLHILAGSQRQRLGVISFYIDGLHYNLGVKLLNDLYGIQVRGGCHCAGTYGHYLLDVTWETSKNITETISRGNLSLKPGWIRLSIHPVMTDSEIHYIMDAIKDIAANYSKYNADYDYIAEKNEFVHKLDRGTERTMAQSWFDVCDFLKKR